MTQQWSLCHALCPTWTTTRLSNRLLSCDVDIPNIFLVFGTHCRQVHLEAGQVNSWWQWQSNYITWWDRAINEDKISPFLFPSVPLLLTIQSMFPGETCKVSMPWTHQICYRRSTCSRLTFATFTSIAPSSSNIKSSGRTVWAKFS